MDLCSRVSESPLGLYLVLRLESLVATTKAPILVLLQDL